MIDRTFAHPMCLPDRAQYWKTLLIAAIYYVIPSMEFVIYQYQHLDDTICYYNEMCMRPALGFVAFNNVASNLVYITLGFLWILFVWVNSLAARKIPDNVGLGRDFSLYYCMVPHRAPYGAHDWTGRRNDL